MKAEMMLYEKLTERPNKRTYYWNHRLTKTKLYIKKKYKMDINKEENLNRDI